MTYGDPNDPPTGRAQVPGPRPQGPSGRASVPGTPRTSGFAGSASVPTSGGATGRASVGRASVRPSSPMDDPGDILEGGPGTRPGMGPPGVRPTRSPKNKAKRRRRRNIFIVGIAAFIMLAGVGMVSGTYYFDNVALPQDISMKQSTTIYYADGTQMAKVGEENRTMITIKDVPLDVQHAVVATEDNSFYTNSGVDYKGIARAAWNNFTGGETQGASTISQQYARHWAELTGVTYGRKLREAVIAMKLNKTYSKPKILEMYLNIVYFGRGAYGIEAASEAYFNKPVSKLTMAEGMALAALIKDPEGSNKKGSPYDYTVNKQSALDRFNNYIKPNMLKLRFMTQEQFDTIKYPTTTMVPKSDSAALKAQWGLDKPEGLIVHHVMEELSQIKLPNGKLQFADADGDIQNGIRNGGLRIYTTIDRQAQADAVESAGGAKGHPMYNQNANLQAALVSVEPRTGRVRAYYGGPNGSGNDYAAFYTDPVLGSGEPSCCAGHSPGSSFKIYTLATGLINGYSVNSYWNAKSGQKFPGRATPVKNAGEGGGADGKCQSGDPTKCMLWEAAEQSLNTPFYALTNLVGADKVMDTAKAAGIKWMWATVPGKTAAQPMDLQSEPSKNFVPKYFQNEIGFGQYPIRVLDHAAGVATLAAGGWANPAHFVQRVEVKDDSTGKEKVVYGEKIAPKRIPGYTDGIASDLDWVLQKIPKHNNQTLSNGRESAGKTGTWQLGNENNQGNAHAWMIGYTAYGGEKSPGLATAVWVGNKGNEQPIKLKSGKNIAGSTLPGPVWRDFMNNALKDMKMPKANFPDPQFLGDKLEGTGTSPEPTLVPDPNQGGDQNPGDNNPGFPGLPGITPSASSGPGGGGGGEPVPRPSRSRRN